MSPRQMLPWQMLPWQLKSVPDSPRNLPLKFGQNRVTNSWDITDIEFMWGGVVGWCAKSFSCRTQSLLHCVGEISWDLYRASRCDIKNWTFLYDYLDQKMLYTIFLYPFPLSKTICVKLPDLFVTHNIFFKNQLCHTVTKI